MKRKIRKYNSGGMRNNPHTDSGYSKATKSTRTVTSGSNDQKKVTTGTNKGGSNQNSFVSNFSVPNFTFPSVTGITVQGLKAVENARRKKRAKGEFFLSNKKEMPITRDFYSAYKRPLNTKIGSPDEPYMKEAGIIGFKKPPPVDKRSPVRCPDGTLPPCRTKINNTKTQQQVKPQQNFFNLQLNKGGGVPYGPPPKRGPNSQVPPVKLSRGGGAAIKGIKFKGVF